MQDFTQKLSKQRSVLLTFACDILCHICPEPSAEVVCVGTTSPSARCSLRHTVNNQFHLASLMLLLIAPLE